ncbi:DoxX family protein [Roseixanthobacter liquoris]|uniref:DoxX family protein n=1 Tax=Roseixanthobacter liquoris TaxID=3119921 RepID=UPI0037263F99
MFGLSWSEIQLFLIRVYVGLDFIPHFSEKLFEGPGPRGEDIAAFQHMGVPAPAVMVLLAGLCELAAFFGLTFGFWTRLAGLGTALYLIIALALGGHFQNGFLWVNAGGGWEFAAFWAFVCASFVLTGGGPLSLDAVVRRLPGVPPLLRRLSA